MSGMYETSRAAPYAAHDIMVMCEEAHYGDSAPVATAVCPEQEMLEAWLDFTASPWSGSAVA